MKTLTDIIAQGDEAAALQLPIAHNWPQLRGAFILFLRALGEGDILAAELLCRFPEEFTALSSADQALFPSGRAYDIARLQVSRYLAVVGVISDPWEALRNLIRHTDPKCQIELHWHSFRTPAISAGMSPSEISADWLWSLSAEAEGGLRRQSLRRAASLFDGLFNVPAIAASGLLPSEPIGPPPRYDRQGRLLKALPPALAKYHAQAGGTSRSGIQQLWQVISEAGISSLPKDPTANELLARDTWDTLEALPPTLTLYEAARWAQILRTARTVLLQHADVDCSGPMRLSTELEAMIATPADRTVLHALWRRMCDFGQQDAAIAELLQLTTWRSLWGEVPLGVKDDTWKLYEGRARKLLVRHGVQRQDPYRLVTRAWADLPSQTKTSLEPIRRQAERALLRPLDLTPEWVAAQYLTLETEAAVVEVVRGVFFEAAQVRQADLLPSPAAVEWRDLHSVATAEGLSVNGLRPLESRAIADGLGPSQLTATWATATAESIPSGQRSRFARALRMIDYWPKRAGLSSRLPLTPLGPLPDFRKCCAAEPPAAILAEVDAVTAAHRRAPSTRREARATVRKVWTAKVGASGKRATESLRTLLNDATVLPLDKRSRRKAKLLLSDLETMDATNHQLH